MPRLLPFSGFGSRSHLTSTTLAEFCGEHFCPSHVLSGGMGAQEELSQPVGDKLLCFAGEVASSGGYHATVHGAFATGRRAAEEVLERLPKRELRRHNRYLRSA